MSEQIEKIDYFNGDYRWLSNFYEAPLVYNGITWKTLEHAFQAAKTEDAAEKKKVWLAFSPGDAKRLGRKVTMRKDWNDIRISVMKGLLEIKFSKEPLRGKLLATGDAELIEKNTWGDCFWGVCNGQGNNVLGILLMEVRAEIRKNAQ